MAGTDIICTHQGQDLTWVLCSCHLISRVFLGQMYCLHFIDKKSEAHSQGCVAIRGSTPSRVGRYRGMNLDFFLHLSALSSPPSP